MKLLTNANSTFLTGDLLADAVMAYATQLANGRRVDAVTIPVIGEDGVVRTADIAVGWHIVLTAVSEPARRPELIDDVVVRDLISRVAAIRPPRARPFTHEEVRALQW